MTALARRRVRPKIKAECPGWYCEYHPWLPFLHDDCKGPGILATARVGMLVHQRKLLEQQIKEMALVIDMMATVLTEKGVL